MAVSISADKTILKITGGEYTVWENEEDEVDPRWELGFFCELFGKSAFFFSFFSSSSFGELISLFFVHISYWLIASATKSKIHKKMSFFRVFCLSSFWFDFIWRDWYFFFFLRGISQCGTCVCWFTDVVLVSCGLCCQIHEWSVVCSCACFWFFFYKKSSYSTIVLESLFP